MNNDIVVLPDTPKTIVTVPTQPVPVIETAKLGVLYHAPLATTLTPGIVQIGIGLLVSNGLVSVNPDIIKIEHVSLNGVEILPDANKNIAINLDKNSVGLNNVDNTSDLDKPISTDTLNALNEKLDKQQNIIYFGKILYVSETGAISFKDENTDINANAFVEVSLNTTTGVLQFTKENGDIVSIDFPLEELVTDGYYDTITEEIVLVLANGNEIRFSVSKLVDIYQGDDETIEIYVDQETNTNKIRIKSSVMQRLVAVENQITQTNNQVATNTTNISSLQQISHVHNNKSILDNIEQPFTTALKNKIDNIEDNAQVNVIEAVKVNGTTLVPTNKIISIAVPTKTSDLTNDSGFITNAVNDLTNYYTKSQIDGVISSVYKPAGSVAFANLPILAANVLGNVYNVTNAFTTDPRFVEGAGNPYPAGTNVVVVSAGATYQFDVLAGFVDLSNYQTLITSSNKISADNVDDSSATNKFVTSSDKTTWNGKQDVLTAGASIDITNNTISVIVDSALSSTSENPLQNKVVNTGLFNLRTLINGKQDILTFDTVPTENSSNPVTSGGVYSAVVIKGGVYRGTFGNWSTVPSTTTGYTADANGNTTPLKDDYMILNDGSGKLDDSSFLYLSDTSGSRASIANTYNGNTQSVVYYKATGESNAVTLNGVVSVYYNSNTGKWVVKTLKACTFNSVTYAVGDTIAQWAYSTYAQGYIAYEANTNGGIFVYDGVWGTDGKNGWKTAASIISMTTGIQNAINTKQNTLTPGTGITIVNDVISSTGGVTVDSALSSTSENPVQNKVINSALGNKLNTSGGAVSGDINYSAGVGSGFNTNSNGKFLIYGATDSLYVQKKNTGGTVTGYFKLMDGDGKLYSQNNEVYTKSMILDFIYPIGSYFITENASLSTVAQVQAHFGGTWVQVTGRFLYGSTTAGTEAGEETHTLTIDEMPSHTHNIKLETGSLTGSSGRVKWAGNGDYQLYANSIMPTGGGQAHNNMPPYRTVYMFRRTA